MSALLLTDWIPCTTPPVRDGEYEFVCTDLGLQHIDLKPGRAVFKNGAWHDRLSEHPLNGMNLSPQYFSWRGRRMWVLVRREDPIVSALAGQPVDVYVNKRTRRTTRFSGLQDAVAFETKEAAERYRDKGRYETGAGGIEAVLS